MMTLQEIIDETSISKSAILRLRADYQKILNEYYDQMPIFGEQGGIIEIDESKFQKKYGKGRSTKLGWVFGITQRDTNKSYFTSVPNRSALTLIPIIQEQVSQNCNAILSDEFRTYWRLRRLGYNHFMVNHNENFVSNERGLYIPQNFKRLRKPQALTFPVHTQTIESRWKQLKRLLRQHEGIRKDNLQCWINMAHFKVQFKGDKTLKMLEIYDEMSKNPTQ